MKLMISISIFTIILWMLEEDGGGRILDDIYGIYQRIITNTLNLRGKVSQIGWQTLILMHKKRDKMDLKKYRSYVHIKY